MERYQDDYEYEKEVLGLIYKTEDELTEVEKKSLDILTAPIKEQLKKIVAQLPDQPFGVPNLTDTTKFDGNLNDQFKDIK